MAESAGRSPSSAEYAVLVRTSTENRFGHAPTTLRPRRITHSGLDHVTITVADLDEAEHFYGLLGFEETAATIVSGERMSQYMGIPYWQADHVTLTLRGAATHQGAQLLRFHRPPLPAAPDGPIWRARGSATSVLPSKTSMPPWPGFHPTECGPATSSWTSMIGDLRSASDPAM
jgi:catechol 2,3-dioxygenase-like lactoylglutathione lyase family enzyme